MVMNKLFSLGVLTLTHYKHFRDVCYVPYPSHRNAKHLECFKHPFAYGLVAGSTIFPQSTPMGLNGPPCKEGVGVFSRVVIFLLKICPPRTQLV